MHNKRVKLTAATAVAAAAAATATAAAPPSRGLNRRCTRGTRVCLCPHNGRCYTREHDSYANYRAYTQTGFGACARARFAGSLSPLDYPRVSPFARSSRPPLIINSLFMQLFLASAKSPVYVYSTRGKRYVLLSRIISPSSIIRRCIISKFWLQSSRAIRGRFPEESIGPEKEGVSVYLSIGAGARGTFAMTEISRETIRTDGYVNVIVRGGILEFPPYSIRHQIQCVVTCSRKNQEQLLGDSRWRIRWMMHESVRSKYSFPSRVSHDARIFGKSLARSRCKFSRLRFLKRGRTAI